MRSKISQMPALSRYLPLLTRYVNGARTLYRLYRLVEQLAEVVGPFMGPLG